MDNTKELFNESHRRYNILTGEWVQVSPHRMKRPWQGGEEKIASAKRPEYDPGCYLCAGNQRSTGQRNPNYENTFVFGNDFPALIADLQDTTFNKGLLHAKSERGLCKVICYSPRHDLTIAELPVADINLVVEAWIEECHALGALDNVNHIQIFENKGETMGCSNPHPHGQIWAQESIPVEPQKKQQHQTQYYQKHQSTLLGAYLAQELADGDRIIFENDHFVALVPFWAAWPFEAMIIPRRPMSKITELTAEEQLAFAASYKELAIRYDKLFAVSFPYSAGIHQAPFDGKSHPEWHWHMVFYPPLLRSATVKKFMVGYEMMANPQRDLTAEQAASRLRY